jgi:hypothetical protein
MQNQGIGSAQSNGTSDQFTLGSSDDLDSIVEKQPVFREGSLLVDVSSLRHRGQVVMISEWYQGAAPYFGEKIWLSFDGAQYRMGNRFRHGAEVPLDSDFSHGEISDQPHDYREKWAFDAGLVYFAPFFHSDDEGVNTLADTLRYKLDRGLEFRASEDDPDIWLIGFNDGCETCRVEYSCSRGVVRSVDWGGGDPFRVYRRREAEDFVQVADGFWAPTAIRAMSIPCGGAPDMTRTEFFNVKFNPPVDDADFRIQLPLGMQVDDP